MEYRPDPSRRGVADDESGRVRLVPVPDGTLVLPLSGDGQLSVRSSGRRKRLRLDEEREDDDEGHDDRHPDPPGDESENRLEVAAPGLLDLDGLEQCLEVADAEATTAVALDDLEEERRPILDGSGEDLK